MRILPKIIFRFNPIDKEIALTFDDGPNPIYTPQILDILAEYKLPASFFVAGIKAEKYPEIIKRTIKEGHDIGNHSYDHPNLIFKSKKFIEEQIVRTDLILRDSGWKNEIYFRPPYGRFLFNGFAVLKKLDKQVIMWNITSKDYRADGFPNIKKRIEKKLKPGGIIVLHDSGMSLQNTADKDRSGTVELVEYLCRKLPKEGYRFRTISEILSRN